MWHKYVTLKKHFYFFHFSRNLTFNTKGILQTIKWNLLKQKDIKYPRKIQFSLKIYSQIKNVFYLNQCLVPLHFKTLVPSPIRLDWFVIRAQLQYWFGLSVTFNCCTIYRSGTFHLKNSLVGSCKVTFQLIDTSAQFFLPTHSFRSKLDIHRGAIMKMIIAKMSRYTFVSSTSPLQ